MAVDGVAPRAKMNQQRGRRFRSAREAELNEKKARDKGEKLPEEDRFDSNCITPGTPFMVRLQEQLKYFVNNKISTDGLWKGTKVCSTYIIVVCVFACNRLSCRATRPLEKGSTRSWTISGTRSPCLGMTPTPGTASTDWMQTS